MMDFRRKKKRGQNQKVRRTWFSEDGYRIVWRKEVYGVRVPPRYQACVRVLIPYSDGQLRPMWDFVNHNRRLMKTLKAAQEECEKHKRLWTKAIEAGGIRVLKELFGGKLPVGLPLWARKKLDRRLCAVLIDKRPGKSCADEDDETRTGDSQPASHASGPGGPTRASDSSAIPTEVPPAIPTPASSADGKERSTTRTTRRARSKGASTDVPSPAPLAESPAKGRKKPAVRRIEKSSKRAGKRKRDTTATPASGAKRSRSSRKTKSVPCGS